MLKKPALRFYDAHNHQQESSPDAPDAPNVSASVVNGTHEADWPTVAEIARKNPTCIPSFGAHPWYIPSLSPQWLTTLQELLTTTTAAVGEAGLDGVRAPVPLATQEPVLRAQLELAATLNRPITLHGSKAWQPLYEVLRSAPRPACGFLLHSYAGPPELIPRFVELGGYFSCAGAILQPTAKGRRQAFLQIPHDRMLVESDAPFQPSPAARARPDQQSRPSDVIELVSVLAAESGQALDRFAGQIEENFRRLFGGCHSLIQRV